QVAHHRTFLRRLEGASLTEVRVDEAFTNAAHNHGQLAGQVRRLHGRSELLGRDRVRARVAIEALEAVLKAVTLDLDLHVVARLGGVPGHRQVLAEWIGGAGLRACDHEGLWQRGDGADRISPATLAIAGFVTAA